MSESAAPKPGSAVTLAIVMRPEKGWHGYWRNPGDAGLPLEPKWTLPAGASVDQLRYPAPGRLMVAGLMNHVFEGEYALLTTLRLPATMPPGTPVPVHLQARWLACTDTICVPEQANLTLDLAAGDGSITADARALFDGYRAALPRPLGANARFERNGERLRLAIPYPAAAPVSTPWFFAATKNLVRYAPEQRFARKGDLLIVDIAAAPSAGTATVVEGVLDVGGTALEVTARPGPVPTDGTALDSAAAMPASWKRFLLALGGALLGGLFLNVMPCVFPILSLKAVALARAGGDEREARMEALAYTGGIMLACQALGGLMLALRAGGQSVGWAFQLQDARVIALLLMLVVAITLNLAGLFALPALDGGRASRGARGAFLTGLLAAFVATPCTGPFMAAAMGAALLLPWPLALAVFAGLGLGLALPFLALAFVPSLRRRLPRPGPWMERLRRIMAVPMALTALALGWLLWRQAGQGGAVLAAALGIAIVALCWLGGRRQSLGLRAVPVVLPLAVLAMAVAVVIPPRLPRTTDVAATGAVLFSEARLADERAAGRPVFLYFTADWCVTCKVNEAAAIDRADVRSAFARHGVTVMQGDWTRGDPAITRFLEAHGRSGVPLYLYYPAGQGAPRELPQLLTPGLLIEAIGG